MARFSRKQVKSRWVQGGIMAAAGLVSLALLVPIWLQVTDRLKEMDVSHRDNVIWTITQMEVEFLELEKASHKLQTEGSAALADLHRRFNVLYSRVGTLEQSPLYRQAIIEAGEIEALARVSAGLNALIALMDGPPEDLLARDQELQTQLALLRPDARRIATNANFILVTSTEINRRETADLVTKLGIVSLVLFGSLFGLAVLFSRLYFIYKRRAGENLMTTQRLATVIETSPDAIVVVNSAGRVQEFNSAASLLLEYSISEAMGMDFSQMLREENCDRAQLPIKGKEVFRQRMCGCTQSGRTMPLEVSQGATSVEQQPVYVYFLRDISDRLKAEATLKASLDKAVAGEQAKAHFLAVMSHEMRTPLNGILGIVDLMKDRLIESKNRHFLSLLEQSGKVFLEHVNEVLDLTEIEARGITLNAAPFSLDEMLEELTASMRPTAEAKGNALVLSKDPAELGYFESDTMRLRQIVANLLGNAVKFTQDGQIELLVSVDRADDSAMLDIQVIDTGIGIDPVQQSQVFDDFVRAHTTENDKIEGTGLGLGIVRRIVSVMQGELGVESVPGEGSLFWARLPLKPMDSAVNYASAPSPVETSETRGLKILIVEDNPTNRFVLKEMLEQDEHNVYQAENGRLGVEVARAQKFDVILMDINMPVMGGVEATREIRASGANVDTRIVALTAHVLDQDAQLYREVGMDGVVAKPISRRNIRNVLSGQGPERRPARRNATLDTTILDQLASTMPAHRVHLVVEGAIGEGDAFVEAMTQDNLETDNDLLEAVHNLSGTAAMIGAIRLRNTLAQLEIKLRTHGTVDLGTWIGALRALWIETRQALVDYADQLNNSESV